LKQQTNKEELKNIILEMVAKEMPKNTAVIVQYMLKKYNLSSRTTTQLLMELENEAKLSFINPEIMMSHSLKEFVFSQKAFWYWEIIALSIATLVSVVTIPEGKYPLAFVRVVLAGTFLFFLPGYVLIKTLFPKTLPFKTAAQGLDNIERITLSIGMSLVLTTLLGLILNFSQWGIRLTPLVLSLGLLVLTIAFGTVAVFREYRAKAHIFNITPKN
jgi:hypothetical protein